MTDGLNFKIFHRGELVDTISASEGHRTSDFAARVWARRSGADRDDVFAVVDVATVPPLVDAVFDDRFVARCDELGRELGMTRDDGETYIRFAQRLVAALRRPRLATLEGDA